MKSQIKTDHLTVSPILNEADARMMYAAYRFGTMPWNLPKALGPKEFVDLSDEIIQANYELNWSVHDGEKVLCVLFGKNALRFILLGGIIWWPQIGKKGKVEAAAAALNHIRKDYVGVIEAEYEYKKFYELLANHKLLRRVGSLYDTIEKGSRTTFFQTRAA